MTFPSDNLPLKWFFDKAAANYDKFCFLQNSAADQLIKRLELIKNKPLSILDVGAGPGYAARLLEKHYPKAEISVLDFSSQMLLQARKKAKWFTKQKFVLATAEKIPFPDQSIDFIFSNMMLPWATDLYAVFEEWQRVLKPEGLLLFSTLGPDTLKELRASWAEIDSAAHVNTFLDLHDVGDALFKARFIDPVMDVQHYELAYCSVSQLIKELKGCGSHNIEALKSRGLTGKNKYKDMVEHYKKYQNFNAKFIATFEVVFGHAWGADLQQFKNNSAYATIPVSKIMRWNRSS